jgi:hypothetical protein
VTIDLTGVEEVTTPVVRASTKINSLSTHDS